DKQRIVGKIFDALGEAPARPLPPPTAPAARTEPPRTREEPPRTAYLGELWFGASHLPPHPPPVRNGFPRLLVGGGRPLSFSTFFSQGAERDGWIPHFSIDLYGVMEPDDQVIVELGDVEARCIVRVDTHGEAAHVRVPCAAPENRKQTRSAG